MNINEINNTRQRVQSLIEQSRLNEAFAALEPMLVESGVWSLREQVEQLQMSYNFMLQYLAQGIADPQRHEVLTHITNQLSTITEQCAIALLEPLSPEVFYARRRELNDTPLSDLLQRYRAELGKSQLLQSVPTDQRDQRAIDTVTRQSELIETAIFNKIWCTFPTTDAEAQLVGSIWADDDLPEHTKCLMVSALLLGLLRVYDERKVTLLADAYTASDLPQVQLRAVVGVMIALKLHEKRASHSQLIDEHVKAMADDPQLPRDLAMAQFLLARTRNTENITRRVQQDLMPGLMKMRPDMLNKMRQQGSDIIDLEANPEWQQMLEDSGMARKMEEFNEMQLDGSDVFISTFSRLKSFPFFQTLSNWFLPFHADHSAVCSAFVDAEAPLRMLVEKAPFLCNSDRYSFGLSLAAVPYSQRQLMLGQIKHHTEELGEMQSAELPNKQHERERLTNMYVQDLYRFFKLFSRRREFIAAFDGDMDFTQLPWLGKWMCQPDGLQLVAEFYFKNGFYDDAIKYYGYLLNSCDNADPHTFQKLGFCYQSKGDAAEALKQYQRYELADDRDVWTIKHMAACHRELNDYEQALACYRRADDLQPGNVSTIINMGHCKLEQGKLDEAMQLYFKADLTEEGTKRHRAWRPVAWCSFLLGADDRSLEYYERIIAQDKPTAQDYLNRGHVLMAMQRIQDAIESYRTSLDLENGDADKLRKAIYADLQPLIARGIDANDLPIIIDAITREK
ncbi:MAG: tetratricopeptide repeat protein [Muribaculaceae bacterium]|nr:tetratricopeptide repeat protein [Muribaculaceae bacterium]